MKKIPIITLIITTFFLVPNIYAQSKENKTTEKLIKSENKKNNDTVVFNWNGKDFKIIETTEEKSIPEITLSFGFNFDFLDGIKTNDLYADLNANIPFILNNPATKSKKDAWWESFGLEFGIYEMKTLSNIDTLTEQYRLTDGEYDADSVFYIKYITADSEAKYTTNRDNLGVFLQPKYTFRFADDNEKTLLSPFLHIEWTRSTIESRLDRTFSLDTQINIVPSFWPVPFETIHKLPQKTEHSKYQEYNTNIGFGFDIKAKRKSGVIHLKGMIGYNYSKLVNRLDTTFILKENRNPFYAIQAEIAENKFLGIKLGVEVRGYLKGDKPHYVLDRNTPYFTIFLAKQFSFNKIAEFIKP